MKAIRAAGKESKGDTKPRGTTSSTFDQRVFSLGLWEESRKSNASYSHPGGDIEYQRRIGDRFGADGMMAGKVPLTEPANTSMPAAPIPPTRNSAMFEAGKMQADARRVSGSHSLMTMHAGTNLFNNYFARVFTVRYSNCLP